MNEKPGKLRPFQFGLGSLFLLTAIVAAGAWVGGALSLEVAKFGLVGLLLWAMMALHPRTARND
jgi:hypothetical protein